MIFFTGLHQPSDAQHFDRAFISVNRIRNRKGSFQVRDWIMDSGAFTEIATYGHYRHGVESYAEQIVRWKSIGNMIAAVAQDYMCEPFIVTKTGLSVEDHQRLTVERYDALLACNVGAYIMPVLQGFAPRDYADHLSAYGGRIAPDAYVGVGSVCKRNGNPAAIMAVLDSILSVRPDLRLHGFGLKTTALSCAPITDALHSADSMAWSFAARREGRNPNDWREAQAFTARILSKSRRKTAIQMEMPV